jgi:hypothetical protein
LVACRPGGPRGWRSSVASARATKPPPPAAPAFSSLAARSAERRRVRCRSAAVAPERARLAELTTSSGAASSSGVSGTKSTPWRPVGAARGGGEAGEPLVRLREPLPPERSISGALHASARSARSVRARRRGGRRAVGVPRPRTRMARRGAGGRRAASRRRVERVYAGAEVRAGASEARLAIVLVASLSKQALRALLGATRLWRSRAPLRAEQQVGDNAQSTPDPRPEAPGPRAPVGCCLARPPAVAEQ